MRPTTRAAAGGAKRNHASPPHRTPITIGRPVALGLLGGLARTLGRHSTWCSAFTIDLREVRRGRRSLASGRRRGATGGGVKRHYLAAMAS